jgi:hypothetical protein
MAEKAGKAEWDFLVWSTFPSSLKLVNFQTDRDFAYKPVDKLSVKPGSTVKVEIKAKIQDVAGPIYRWAAGSRIRVTGWYPNREEHMFTEFPDHFIGTGTLDWHTVSFEGKIPAEINMISLYLTCGYASSKDKPATTWFDDLKIYQDGVLIYANDFTNWNPYIGAGAGGALTAVPAYLITRKPEYALVGIIGALIGAGVGYATAKP